MATVVIAFHTLGVVKVVVVVGKGVEVVVGDVLKTFHSKVVVGVVGVV